VNEIFIWGKKNSGGKNSPKLRCLETTENIRARKMCLDLSDILYRVTKILFFACGGEIKKKGKQEINI
jgi:hypothetical protein